MTDYVVRRVPRRETMRLRGLDIRLTRWGPPPTVAEPPVFLLHGWLDTGDTFQFLVDELARDRPLVALDWRGFGHSEWAREGYWFPDYLADLDALLDRLSPGVPARLVGHSMGGNIAALYAGLRPERVHCLVNLEGFGLPRILPAQTPGRMRRWLDQVKADPPVKEYGSQEELASLVQLRYPRFSAAQARYIARSWSKTHADGRVRLLGDARHRWTNPLAARREDAEACWREIRAPMLLLLGEHSEFLPTLGSDGTEDALRAVLPCTTIATLSDAGHMLHIEQASLVAGHIDRFLDAHR